METPHNPDFDTKIRAILAVGLLTIICLVIGYTLIVWGHILAVLTLILGWATGTANVLLSPYFGSPNASKKGDTGQVNVTGDQPVVNTATPTEETK